MRCGVYMTAKINKYLLPLFFFFLTVGYFMTRLVNLTVIPVFADEAIYIRWAQVMRAVSSLRFVPLSDGKQPFFMWLIIPFLKIFSDPLVAGRMVSVLAGFGTALGTGVLGYLLFKKKEIALFAVILYLISPFTFFFDRMAMADGLLSCFGVWFLVLTALLVNNLRLDLAMLAGIALGLGLITKSPAMIFAILLPSTLLLLTAHRKLTFKLPVIAGKQHLMSVGKLFGLWAVIYFFAFAIYNILRLGPEFHMIAIRNKDYVFPLSEILKHPLNPLTGNLKSTLSWYWILLTPGVFLVGLGGLFLALRKNFKPALLLLVWWLVPLVAQGLIAKVYTARYVLFSVPLFLIFSAYALWLFFEKTKNKWLVILFLALIFVFPVYQLLLLLGNPQKAWIPQNERSGYLEEWTAGYGIRESADYIRKTAQNGRVLVGTEGYFGTLPDGLQIYLEKVPNITIIGVGYPINEISSKLTDGLKDSRVFLLVNDTRFKVKETKGLRLVAKYPKAVSAKTGNQENLLFFEILAD